MTNEITIALPTEDRVRAYEFYRTALILPSVGEPAEDGVPEPLQFRLDTGTTLMFVPTGGFGWVLGGRDSAPAGSHEVLLSLTLDSAEEVRATTERMLEAGAEIVLEPTEQPWGFSAVVTDPDGHAWQLIAAQG